MAYRPHKYGAKATWVGDVRFASRAEANRYLELDLLVKASEITGLKLQPRFPLHVGKVKIGTYVADFRYLTRQGEVVEDVKGMPTALYKWKKKHFEAEYGIQITEITKPAPRRRR